jgi:Family of unknown function (DUF6073)
MSPQTTTKVATALKLVDPLEPEGLAPNPKSLSSLRLLRMPRGGVDRLSFTTWDTIDVPGFGEDTFKLQGHYVIERADPTSASWHDASVDIYMRELSVSGVSEKFGRVDVTVNAEIGKQSGGQVKPGTRYLDLVDAPKLCVMEGFMMFSLIDVGMTLFNKEPIQLTHFITHIPPIGQGGGTQGRVDVKLYRLDDPDGPAIATLREVRTHIGAWTD